MCKEKYLLTTYQSFPYLSRVVSIKTHNYLSSLSVRSEQAKMSRPILILGTFAVFFVVATYSQVRIIRPIYRPPRRPRYHILRIAREARDPIRLFKDDNVNQLTSERPLIYDDIKMDPSKRYVRSLSTPGHGRASGSSSSKGSRGHDTGATHPGYNRRSAREAGDAPVGQFIRWPSTKEKKVRSSIYKDINLYPSVNEAGGIPSLGKPSDSTSESSFMDDTGAMPSGYHRKTRSLNYPTLLPPFNPRPKPWNPPRLPIPMPQRPRFPIYV